MQDILHGVRTPLPPAMQDNFVLRDHILEAPPLPMQGQGDDEHSKSTLPSLSSLDPYYPMADISGTLDAPTPLRQRAIPGMVTMWDSRFELLRE